MKKIVINNCYGGFSLSKTATNRLKELGMTDDEVKWDWNIPRDDQRLVQAVEELGKKASGKYSSLKIVEIPDDVEWEIEEYDGSEWVSEKHRTWE